MSRGRYRETVLFFFLLNILKKLIVYMFERCHRTRNLRLSHPLPVATRRVFRFSHFRNEFSILFQYNTSQRARGVLHARRGLVLQAQYNYVFHKDGVGRSSIPGVDRVTKWFLTVVKL